MNPHDKPLRIIVKPRTYQEKDDNGNFGVKISARLSEYNIRILNILNTINNRDEHDPQTTFTTHFGFSIPGYGGALKLKWDIYGNSLIIALNNTLTGDMQQDDSKKLFNGTQLWKTKVLNLNNGDVVIDGGDQTRDEMSRDITKIIHNKTNIEKFLSEADKLIAQYTGKNNKK